ncbi:MAG TPA: hypothetical protein HA263_05815 [Methanoregulaceae archaeon]|nr:hypothetical protein [Methanoregulaceae archaeon]
MTPEQRSRSPRWVTIGLATRERAALRLEIIAGPERGSYHVSAEDVPALLEGHDPVPLYRLRSRKGQEVPFESGFCYHADSGRMVICRFASGFRAMLPVAAVRAHYADPEANKPTRIAAPADQFEQTTLEASA